MQRIQIQPLCKVPQAQFCGGEVCMGEAGSLRLMFFRRRCKNMGFHVWDVQGDSCINRLSSHGRIGRYALRS